MKGSFPWWGLAGFLWACLIAPCQSVGAEALPFDLHGFVEAGGGLRTQNDPNQSSDASYAELRLQIEASKALEEAEVKFRLDLFRDQAVEDFNADLREAHVLLFPANFVDLKLGRQILTWGTGDLIFLNDLFPKDFQSFFIGREESYLKAPSNSMKASFFLIGLTRIWSGTRCSSLTASSTASAFPFSIPSSVEKLVSANN